MSRFLPSVLVLLLSSASAVSQNTSHTSSRQSHAQTATISPIGVLRNAGLIRNVQFQDQRTNYSIWRFRGSGQASMQGLFMNGSHLKSQANQVRTVQLSLSSPNQTFRKRQVETLQKAAEEISSKCFGNDLKNLDVFLQNALDSKAWPSVSRGRSTTITIVPAGQGARLTVEIDLPAGKTPQCRLPRA